MSLGTILIFIVFLMTHVLYKNRPEEAQWKLFGLTLFISTFVNCGYAFKIGSITITYNIWCEILYIVGAVLLVNKDSFFVKKKVLISDCIVIIAIIAGLYVLQYNKERPLIIPWTTRMDDVYYQLAKAEYPQLGYGNYLNLFYGAFFFLFMALSVRFLNDEKYVERMIRNVKSFYKCLIVSMIVEFLFNNLISPTLLRSCVRAITGVATHGYDAPQKRFGLYGILQLFNESSYFCLFIILYILLLIEGIKSDFNIKWVWLSIVVLLLTGSTSAWIVIPVAILAILKDTTIRKKRSSFLNGIITIVIVGIISLFLFVMNSQYLSTLISGMTNKVFTYLTGTYDSLAVSGSIRHMGNQYAYNAFSKSVFWGWGIGTLRSYGLLPSALGCFGLVGTGAVLLYLKEHCNLKIRKKNILAVVLLCAYSTSILSVGYLYDPSIVLIAFPFNALLLREGKNSV